MGYTAKVLAEGQLATSKGTLYTVPGSTTAYIRFITLYNTNAATQTVNIYFKPGSTSRQVRKISLAQGESCVLDIDATLEAADLIEGDTTTTTAVDYVITGVEQT